jgi:hypothetical protein
MLHSASTPSLGTTNPHAARQRAPSLEENTPMAIWNVELTLTLRMPHVIAVEADDADRAQRMAARVLAHEVKALLCPQRFELQFPEESPPAVFLDYRIGVTLATEAGLSSHADTDTHA